MSEPASDSPEWTGLNSEGTAAAPAGTIVQEPSGRRPGDRTRGGPTKGRLTAFAAALAGSAVLGVAAGLIWGLVAPRAMLLQVGHGEAELLNAESGAFIAADLWFCLIAVLGGVITGVVGYRLLVRRAGWTAAAGLVLGAAAAALLALWAGENVGLGTYNHLLAVSPAGTVFRASLALGAKSALAFWPGLTSAVMLLADYGGRQDQAPGGESAENQPPAPDVEMGGTYSP